MDAQVVLATSSSCEEWWSYFSDDDTALSPLPIGSLLNVTLLPQCSVTLVVAVVLDLAVYSLSDGVGDGVDDFTRISSFLGWSRFSKTLAANDEDDRFCECTYCPLIAVRRCELHDFEVLSCMWAPKRPNAFKGRFGWCRCRGQHVVDSRLTRFTHAPACVLRPFPAPPTVEHGLPDDPTLRPRWPGSGPSTRQENVFSFQPSSPTRPDCRVNPIATSLGFSGAWRIGEASNPGPPQALVITSANVTSISKRIGDLNSFTQDSHVCLIQEAGLTPSNVNVVRNDLKERGWRRLLSGHLSSPQERQAFKGQRPYRESGNHASGGVAVLSRGVVVTP